MILQGITFVTWQNTQPIAQQVKVKLMGVLSLLRKERKNEYNNINYYVLCHTIYHHVVVD